MRLDLVVTRKADGSLSAAVWENDKGAAGDAFAKAGQDGEEAYFLRRAVWTKRTTSQKGTAKKVAKKKVAKKSAD